jgi:DNA-binding NtrC family response regulator
MSAMNKILIVDDEKAIRNCLSEMLSFMGFDVAVASSGDEALNLFHTDSFDLVLTDLEMPDMDGWALALHIKEKWPHIPVVLITGAEERYVMERMKESCVDYVMFKPFALWEMQKTLKTLLEGKGGSILNG